MGQEHLSSTPVEISRSAPDDLYARTENRENSVILNSPKGVHVIRRVEEVPTYSCSESLGKSITSLIKIYRDHSELVVKKNIPPI